MGRGRVGAVVALCVGLAACSSTVQVGGDRLEAADDAAVVAAGAGGEGDSGAVSDAAAAAVGSGDADVRAASGRTASTRATSGAAARSATGPVRIGVAYSENLGSILTTVGGVDSTDGDAIDSIRPIIQYINDHGGIAGRRVEPVLHGVNPLDGTFSVQEQQTCAAFTEDNTVDAVVTGAAAMGMGLTRCVAAKNVPVLLELHHLVDDIAFSQHRGLLFQPFGVSSDRQGFWVDALAEAGYFGNAKVGIVTVDDPLFKRYVDRVFRPRLAARGITIAAEYAFQMPGSAGEASSLYSQASNAVLRFRSAGITHVLFAPTGGSLPFVFMPTAENQSYRPRYGINSYEIPAFVDLNVANAQLKDALAVGWLPTSDVLTAQRPKDNPAERLCFQITNSRSDIPSRYCEGLFFLKAAWDASRDVTPAGLRRGAQSLADGWHSPWTFATRFGNGRADGARTYRLLRFQPGCQCFEYDGPMRAMP